MTSHARSRRLAVAVVAAAAAVLASMTTAAASDAAPATPQVAAGFSDDFNGPAGSPADASKWNYQAGDNVNNHELQWYTEGNRNAALDGQGHLVITAKKEGGHKCWYGDCQYTSARLTTFGKFTPQFGHIEVRMQLPRGQGMWPAFWMLGANINNTPWPNCGEIDITENVGKEPNAVHGSIHGPGYSGANGLNAPYNGPVFADGFHTYAVDWAKDSITFSVDGKVYGTRTPKDKELQGKQWVFNHQFYLILNLAIGGDWPGKPDGDTTFPAKLVVDYVHAS